MENVTLKLSRTIEGEKIEATFDLSLPTSFEDSDEHLVENDAASFRIYRGAIIGAFKAQAGTYLVENGVEGLQEHMDGFRIPETVRRGGGGGRRKTIKLDAERQASLEALAAKGKMDLSALGDLLGVNFTQPEAEAS